MAGGAYATIRYETDSLNCLRRTSRVQDTQNVPVAAEDGIEVTIRT